MEVHLRRVLIYGFLAPRITEKIGKHGLAHMVSKGTGADPKTFHMNFYDSLVVFFEEMKKLFIKTICLRD